MKLIHDAKQLMPGSRKVCLAIGVFDGVHLGHQQIIRQTVVMRGRTMPSRWSSRLISIPMRLSRRIACRQIFIRGRKNCA